ncbi:MAG: leucine/isoleucine/valine transporter permease subunit [Gemmataceae bacterium]|nr:leucine/isoleucine/valine transporter permease subunit [Gemmataceae bacterium]
MTPRGVLGHWPWAALVVFCAVPFIPGTQAAIYGQQFLPLFIYAVLALGLNAVVGYTGLFHLGIAAFFGIGAYVTGILTVPQFPFQQSFLVAVIFSALAAAAVGVLTTAPTLRLRGDYLALVTMGFGLIAVFVIRNLENITAGTKGLNPVSPHLLPGIDDPNLGALRVRPGWGATWRAYPYFYYLSLVVLVLTYLFLGWVERSRLGRAWVALREDELAAACMGLSPARLKLSAIALGAGLAGLAGALYAVSQRTTAGPQAYDFNRSMTAICCVILGGLGNRPGVLLGVFLLIGYDQVLTPILDNEFQKDWYQQLFPEHMRGKQYLKVSGWRLVIFGAALIIMMRFRPEGLLPEARRKLELEAGDGDGEIR